MDFINQIKGIQTRYFGHHGDGLQITRCLKHGLFSYRPFIDLAIFQEFPKDTDHDFLIDFWNKTFVRYRSNREYVEKTYTLLIEQPEIYYLPFSVFQHEAKSHRFPLSISFVGTFLVFYNSLANHYFLRGLQAKNDNDTNELTRISSALSEIETKIDWMLTSTQYVLEGLALFNDFIVLGIMFQDKKIEKPAQTAFRLITEMIERKKGDIYTKFYEVGFSNAIDIYKKLGRWGAEIATMYALNPLYDLESLQDFPQNEAPNKRFKAITKLTGKEKINRDDPQDILNFIQSKFHWEGWESSRSLILSKVSSMLSELDVPSKDFIIPAKSGSHYLPEMILINNEKLLHRLDKQELEGSLRNFVYTSFRKDHEILSNGEIKEENCPFKLLNQTCTNCEKVTNGKARSIIEGFGEKYGLRTGCNL